jgi:predicted aspartyl protease
MRLFLFTFIACCGLSASLLARAGSAPAVLKQIRLASGGAAWDRVAEIVEHGQMVENGFIGQLTQGEDLKTGSYAFKAEFPIAHARIGQGVHGDEIWTLNQQGNLAVHSGAHDDKGTVTDTYLYWRGYLRRDFDGAAVSIDPPATEAGVSFDRVRITPPRGETVVLWINASTHLLDREQWGDAAKRYSDYREVNGLRLPFAIRHVTNQHEDYAITLERIDVKDKVEDADVAMGFYRDFEMPASGVVTVPTEHGTTFDARINGKGPFKMFFDTGSINILSSTVAKEVGIAPQGDAEKFNGTVDVRPATVKTLQIGDVTMHDQPFGVMDFPGEFAVVGYEFLQRFVVRVDYDHNRITMYDPARFNYSGGGVTVPMLVKSRGLYVKGSMDGFKGQFVLDTGNEVGLEFEPGFVRSNDLVGWTHARFHGYAGRGYAGPAPESYYARIHKLAIGDAEVDDIAANLSQGEPHDGEPDANLGQSVFRQFNCTFDEIRGKLYLEKNGNWGPVPFNRAGIVVDPQDDAMKVMTVLPGNSGEAAGLQVGDLITKIDGKALDDTQDESVFARPVGTVLRLTVKRGQATQEIAVMLKDVL